MAGKGFSEPQARVESLSKCYACLDSHVARARNNQWHHPLGTQSIPENEKCVVWQLEEHERSLGMA